MPVAAIHVAELVEEQIIRVAPDTMLSEVAATLLAANIGVVAVGDGARVSAIVSERDIVRAVAQGYDPTTTPAEKVASFSLIWCDAESTVAEVANEMMEHYVRHVLVEDAGELIGIVSARDLLGVYATADTETETE